MGGVDRSMDLKWTVEIGGRGGCASCLIRESCFNI